MKDTMRERRVSAKARRESVKVRKESMRVKRELMKETMRERRASILNRDMEEKGIVLWELSCWTAAVPSPLELFSSRSTPAGAAGLRLNCHRSFNGSSAPGVHLPELPDCHRQLRLGELGSSPG
ncbi:unnamed protein product [Boreogadus saida]